MLGTELLRYQDNQKYLGVDLETEGLSLGFSRPWELSFATFTNKTIEKSEVYYIRWPNLNVSEAAARVTRFDRKKYEALARDPKEVLDIFETYLYDSQYRILFQNGLFFDIYIHNLWRKALGLTIDYSYLPRCIDLIALSKAYKKGWKPDLTNFATWQYKVLNWREKGLRTSLTTIGKELGIETDYESLHEAGNDVKLMIEIFWKLIWYIDI
jgi:hypothetical protein